jgi:hypothetical protein
MTPKPIESLDEWLEKVWNGSEDYGYATGGGKDEFTRAKAKLEAYCTQRVIDEHQHIKWTPNEATFIERQADRIAELQGDSIKDTQQ